MNEGRLRPFATEEDEVYDYLIVGAGSAGCVLANRLSAEADRRVLLLEAGGSDRAQEVQIPAAFSKQFKTDKDWDLETRAQTTLDNRSIYWPRGCMLGGSSSMNALMWVRGHRADYDGWAEAGCPGWSYDEVVPYFRRAEGAAATNGFLGHEGPLRIENLRTVNPTTRAFLEACRESGLRHLPELNVPEPEGFALTQVTQKRGRRWSAADAYLYPARRRSNLDIVTEARARRIVFEGRRAVGVELLEGGERKFVHAREIVLSAGSVHSPQLLQLSGVGDAERLKALGIEVVTHRQEVGQNLQDHLVVGVIVSCPEPVTLVAAESWRQILQYLLLRRGMLTSNVAEAAAFVRISESSPAPDIELLWAAVPFMDNGFTEPPGHGVTLATILLQPESRGVVTIESPEPAAAPDIDPAYLSDSRDLETLVRGVEVAKRLMASPALARYIGEPLEPAAGEDDLEAFVRAQAETLYHPVGTCRMGSDSSSVVDLEMRVRGVEGLRVIDASVIPRITRGHTHAPTVMIAERAADQMLAAEMSRH